MTNKEAIEILKQVREDYEGNGNVLADGNEALTIAIEALEQMDGLCDQMDDLCENLAFYTNERQRLMKELEESRAKEGKGCLETMFESFGQLFSTINEAMQGMTSEEIRELMRPDEEEEDHEEDRDTESE